MTLKHAIVIAVTFGIVAALVVWWLERFEINKFHGEVRHYIQNYDKFKDYLRENEGTNGA